MKGSRPAFINLDETASQELSEIVQSSCWSIWEGCVCRHLKNHFGSHACDDPDCRTTWTTEQSDEWLDAEQEAHRIDGTVPDRHRKSTKNE